MAYARLWDSLNPKHPWSSNPTVFVIEFRRSEKAGMGDDEPDLRHADLKDDEEG